jgi:F0F1-type ATP synthase membrane subunit c/vacuolar-type H+-ATPase subunit K
LDREIEMDEIAGVQNEKTLTIIWVAMLVSLLVYGGVGSFILAPAPDTVLDPVFSKVFMGIAFSEVVIIFGVLPKLMKPPTIEAAKILYIVRWALAESIGIYGLVLHNLGGGSLHLWGFLGTGALCILMLYPSGDALRQSIAGGGTSSH